MTIDEMKAVDVRTVDPETLVDIRDVEIDQSLPQDERIKSYVQQIRNPYVFKCGEVIVKTYFAESGPSLDDCLERYLKSR